MSNTPSTSKKTINCPGCGNPIGTNWQLCPSCGLDLNPSSTEKPAGVGGIGVIPKRSSCHNCGKEVQPEWVACPYCRARLDGKLSHSQQKTQQHVPHDFKRIVPKFPNAQNGFMTVIMLFVLTAVGEFLAIPSEILSLVGILIGIASVIYWFYHLYCIHRVLQYDKNGAYRITPGKAVWLHFVPIYNIFWIFRWSNYLIGYLNERNARKAGKGGMAILLLLGFIITSFGLILSTQPDSTPALSIAAFGFLLMHAVLNFFRSELTLQPSESYLDDLPGKSTRPEGNLIEQYWLTLWWIGNLLVLLPILLPSSDQSLSALWMIFGIGSIQQILLTLRKPEFMWWAICYFLGWVIGALVFSTIFASLDQDALSTTIIAGLLVGFLMGFFQWLVLRKWLLSGAAWWIATSSLTGPALLGTLIPDNRNVAFLLAIIYILVTGVALEWLLSGQGRDMQRWPNIKRRLFGLQGVFLLVFLLSFPVLSFKAWQTRLLSKTFVDVAANVAWQNTGLRLAKGNKVVIQYWSGSWSIDPANPDDGGFTDANGVPGSTPQKYCDSCDAPSPTGTLGLLVATQDTSRIGIPVGNYLVFMASRDGLLFLMINDNFGQLEDNSGNITVEILVYNE